MSAAARLLTALALCAGALGLGACGPQVVPLDVRFPSTETFLVSRAMRIRIYELDVETTCASLVTAVASGRDPGAAPLWVSGELTPCDVRAGASIPDVGGGARGFLVEGLDLTGNNTILAGCAEDEVFTGNRIEVALFPTSRYQAAYDADRPLAGEEVRDRCGGGS